MIKRIYNAQKLINISVILLLFSFDHTHAHQLSSEAFDNNELIPDTYTYYCKAGHQSSRIVAAGDISPPLTWREIPENTRSFALLLSDSDVTPPSNMNQPNIELTPTVIRSVGYHWVIMNIPASLNHLPAGAGSTGFHIGSLRR